MEHPPPLLYSKCTHFVLVLLRLSSRQIELRRHAGWKPAIRQIWKSALRRLYSIPLAISVGNGQFWSVLEWNHEWTRMNTNGGNQSVPRPEPLPEGEGIPTARRNPYTLTL